MYLKVDTSYNILIWEIDKWWFVVCFSAFLPCPLRAPKVHISFWLICQGSGIESTKMLRKKLDFCTANILMHVSSWTDEDVSLSACHKGLPSGHMLAIYRSKMKIKIIFVCVCLFNFKNLFFVGNLRYT